MTMRSEGVLGVVQTKCYFFFVSYMFTRARGDTYI